MKRKKVEQALVAFLFILVLIVFSLAQKDTKKFDARYTTGTEILQSLLSGLR